MQRNFEDLNRTYTGPLYFSAGHTNHRQKHVMYRLQTHEQSILIVLKEKDGRFKNIFSHKNNLVLKELQNAL